MTTAAMKAMKAPNHGILLTPGPLGIPNPSTLAGLINITNRVNNTDRPPAPKYTRPEGKGNSTSSTVSPKIVSTTKTERMLIHPKLAPKVKEFPDPLTRVQGKN